MFRSMLLHCQSNIDETLRNETRHCIMLKKRGKQLLCMRQDILLAFSGVLLFKSDILCSFDRVGLWKAVFSGCTEFSTPGNPSFGRRPKTTEISHKHQFQH